MLCGCNISDLTRKPADDHKEMCNLYMLHPALHFRRPELFKCCSFFHNLNIGNRPCHYEGLCLVPQYDTELGHRSNCASLSEKMNRRNKKQKTISRRINLPLSFHTLFPFSHLLRRWCVGGVNYGNSHGEAQINSERQK